MFSLQMIDWLIYHTKFLKRISNAQIGGAKKQKKNKTKQNRNNDNNNNNKNEGYQFSCQSKRFTEGDNTQAWR